MSAQHRHVAAIAALCLFSVTCASTAATSTAFPVGSYQNKQTIIVLKPDGTFLGTNPKGEDWVKGTYTNKGNKFTVVDTWEGDAIKGNHGGCVGQVGHYTWTKTGKVMTMHVVDDPCQGRKNGTDGVAWSQIDPVAK